MYEKDVSIRKCSLSMLAKRLELRTAITFNVLPSCYPQKGRWTFGTHHNSIPLEITDLNKIRLLRRKYAQTCLL